MNIKARALGRLTSTCELRTHYTQGSSAGAHTYQAVNSELTVYVWHSQSWEGEGGTAPVPIPECMGHHPLYNSFIFLKDYFKIPPLSFLPQTI